jgi:hypothetical protein
MVDTAQTIRYPGSSIDFNQGVEVASAGPVELPRAPQVTPVQATPELGPMPPMSAGPAPAFPSSPTAVDALPRFEGTNTAFSPSAVAGTGQPVGGGVMDTLTSGFDKAKGFYNEYISPDRLANSPEVLARQSAAADAARARAASLDLSPAATDRLVERAIADASPGVFTRYAPLAALGVGALGAMGGFKPEQPQMPDAFKGPTGYQMYFSQPQRFALNYGGVRPTAYGGMYLQPPGYAEGGGVMDTPQAMRVGGKTYPRKIGAINGPGTGTSDSIPAMLSDGEFVFTAKAVRAMGQGSRRKGAKKMYKLMKMLEGKAA